LFLIFKNYFYINKLKRFKNTKKILILNKKIKFFLKYFQICEKSLCDVESVAFEEDEKFDWGELIEGKGQSVGYWDC